MPCPGRSPRQWRSRDPTRSLSMRPECSLRSASLRMSPRFCSRAAPLRRFEGEAPLGERYGVELSVAYKAAWVRVTRCFSRNAAPRSWELAARWFAETASRLEEKSVSAGPGALPPPGKLASWIVETCTGSQPLSIFAGDRLAPRQTLPAGALASLSLQLSLDDGHWLGGGPLVIGASGRPSLLLI